MGDWSLRKRESQWELMEGKCRACMCEGDEHSDYDACVYVHSLIQRYPKFKARLCESLRRLVGEEVESRVEIEMAQDGSGVGGKFIQNHHLSALFTNRKLTFHALAALCALQATKQGH